VASARRRVVLEDGREIEYDWLSLDVGSAPQRDQIPGVPHERVVPVKPVLKLLKLRERLCAPNPPKLIVVLGAGPSGCEVAANVKTCQPGAAVVIIDAAPHALPWAGPGALVQRILRGRGIAFVLGRRAQRAEGDALHLDDGSIVRFDLLVDATTPMPNRLAATAGLLLDERGAILVDGSSRAIEDPRVFAVGDSSARRGSPVARNGVHAVREGRMLFENLASVLEGRPPRPWSWPDRTLQILDLGDGTALAMRGSWYLRSAAMLWWKSWIDRRWLARWNSLPKAAELSATDSFA
jgi:selenide,water dikinase